jgi:methionyl-tRNA formyltransferase
LRLVFAGTPQFAASHLQALLDSPHHIAGVYTQPDRPSGRGKKLTPSPVKQLALDAGLDIFQPASLRNDEAASELASLQCDLMIVVAYGLILPQQILDTPRRGCLNVHASLLPRWRGAAPIQRAIEAGDVESGICIMQMDAGLDTGPVLARCSVPISPGTNAGQLHDKLAAAGPGLLLEVLADLPRRQRGATRQQESGASYAHKIDKSEARLDWSGDAQQLQRKVLAFNPFPIAWTTLDGQRVKIHDARACDGDGPPGQIIAADSQGIQVACGDGALNISLLQLPGGKALPVAELLNARRELFAVGTVLGKPE